MSPKICSLAIDEIKEQEEHFEPNLRVLINGRYVGSESKVSTEPEKIRGRITVSF